METRRPTNPAAEEILGGYFPVLDHGFVALVDYMGSDEDVERAARVSYGYGTRKVSQTRGLVRYLRRHAHTTPSEMVEFKFHCAMPIFVARQWIRHRTACLAEGTGILFDLPGDPPTGPGHTIRIEELWARRDSWALPLRQLDESRGEIGHTRMVDVFRNGPKPVFRMTLADGRAVECTADHRFLFADGWRTLADGVGLAARDGVPGWRPGGRIYAGPRTGAIGEPGSGAPGPARAGGRAGAAVAAGWTATVPRSEARATLVPIERFDYVGVRPTYDIEVEGPSHNFLANGIVTHNSVNEYSGRYSLMPLLFYRPEADSFALQSRVNHQGRQELPAPERLYAEAMERWESLRSAAADTYGWLVMEDVARELARIDLPLSTYTQWYWKIDLHNLLHFLRLRVDDHAQWEIRQYGEVMAGMLERVAPLSYEAWLDYDVMGARLSAGELAALGRLLEPDPERLALRGREAELSEGDLRDAGLSAREIRELLQKFGPRERPDFSLDLSQMRSAEEMAARLAAAVPEPEQT